MEAVAGVRFEESDGLRFLVYQRTLESTSGELHLPVILLHGWLGSSADFHGLALLLRTLGHDVLVPDLPLHAESHSVDADTPLAAARLVGHAAAAVLRRRVDSCRADSAPDVFLVGYSLGGRLALEAACDPELRTALTVAGLVLISSGLRPDSDEACAARAAKSTELCNTLSAATSRRALKNWLVNTWYSGPMWGGLGAHPAFDTLVENRLTAVLGDEGEDGELSPAARKRLEAVGRAAVLLCPSRMSQELTLPQVDGKSLPVLYIHGEHDTKYQEMASRICSTVAPHAMVSPIPDAGHNVFVQQLSMCSTLVSQFSSPVLHGRSLAFAPTRAVVLRYSLPLKKPMAVGDVQVTSRDGFLLSLSDGNGACGVGDVAPLPGLHPETVDMCLKSIQSWWRDRQTSAGTEPWSTTVKDLVQPPVEDEHALPPPVCSALHAALAQGLASIHRLRVSALLPMLHGRVGYCQSGVLFNGVAPRPSKEALEAIDVNGDRESLDDHVESLVSLSGTAPVFKLKVGYSRSVDFDASIVRCLAPSLRKRSARLRVDANCSWSLSDFLRFSQLTVSCTDLMEYAEEPVRSESVDELVESLSQVYEPGDASEGRSDGVPFVGLDESLVKPGLESTIQLMDAPGVAAIVLKPAAHGSIDRIGRLALEGRRRGLKVVMSSVFESGVGLAWTAVLAGALGHPKHVAHGLGTFGALVGDVTAPSFEESCVFVQESLISIEESELLLLRATYDVLEQGVDLEP